MRQLTRLFFIIYASLYITGCDYVVPFYEANVAIKYDDRGKYKDAIPHYQKSIKGLNKIEYYSGAEYVIRVIYSVTLDEYADTNDDYSTYVLDARKNYERLLELQKDFEDHSIIKSIGFDISRAIFLTHIAQTYMREASSREDEENYYKLIEKAYFIYKDAIKGLEKNKDWHNLAYTYYSLGEAADWYGDYEAAVQWLVLAVELDKKHEFNDDLKDDETYLDELKIKLKNDREKSTRSWPSNIITQYVSNICTERCTINIL